MLHKSSPPRQRCGKKGVKPGDEIISLNGYRPSRDNLWEMQYVYSVLRPQGGMRLDLQNPDGERRQLDVAAKLREGKRVADLTGDQDFWDFIRQGETEERLMRIRHKEYGNQLMVMKLTNFLFSQSEMDGVVNRARNYPTLVIDLRGNPGGNVEALKYLVGRMFNKELKIADRVGRKETKPEKAKAGSNPYTCRLILLIDSDSASAAELFARLVQLEKRGVVIGDHSSGSVMEAKRYSEKLRTDIVIFFGVSVTEWDLIMADGKSLERTGVIPDETLLPSAKGSGKWTRSCLGTCCRTRGRETQC